MHFAGGSDRFYSNGALSEIVGVSERGRAVGAHAIKGWMRNMLGRRRVLGRVMMGKPKPNNT